MENWCYDEDTALGMAHHYVSGQPLPIEMLDKLRGARVHMAGVCTILEYLVPFLDLDCVQIEHLAPFRAQMVWSTAYMKPSLWCTVLCIWCRSSTNQNAFFNANLI